MDSFEDGATLTLPNHVLRYKTTGEYYRWDGELLKQLLPVQLLHHLEVLGLEKWLSVGDAALRSDLADTNGSGLIGTKSALSGAVARTIHDKLSDSVSIYDFGATWDGSLHPLSEKFSTLSAAQMVYPFVTSLDQSTDYAAIQAACNSKRRY